MKSEIKSNFNNIAAVILAAGKGTRMNLDIPKVLVPLKNKPLIHYVLDSIKQFGFSKIVVVVGFQAEKVRSFISSLSSLSNCAVDFAFQQQQLGTGHAVLQSESLLKNFKGDVLILYGDVPLLSTRTIKDLINSHKSSGAVVTILTAIFDNPFSYGRIIRNNNDKNKKNNDIIDIVEERDASPEQKKIKEINSGIYIVKSDFLFKALKQIKPENNQKEIYLTDIAKIASRNNIKINSFTTINPDEVKGINSVEDLKSAEKLIKHN